MVSVIALCIIIIACVLLFIYFGQPSSNLTAPIHVQGVRLNISLEEIFNKVIPSQKIDVAAILDTNYNVIWSDNIQLNLSSEYYNVKTYIIIISDPVKLKLDDISLFEKEVTERFEFILKRTKVFISLTDVNGKSTSTANAYTNKFGITLLLGIFTITAGLYIYLHFLKDLKGQRNNK
jgi:hypothetical protein